MQRVTATSRLFFILVLCGVAFPSFGNDQEIENKIRSQFNFEKPFKLIDGGINGYYAMMFANDWAQVLYFREDLSMFGASAFWSTTPQKNKKVAVSDDKALEIIRHDLITNIKLDYLLGPYGHGSRKVVVYSAPDCPFCREFDKAMLSIAKAHDISFYIMPAVLRGDSASFRAGIWCSAQPMKTWEAAIQHRRLPSSTPCKKSRVVNVVADAFFTKRPDGVYPLSTPAFVFEDRRLVTGFSAEKVQAVFAKQ